MNTRRSFLKSLCVIAATPFIAEMVKPAMALPATPEIALVKIRVVTNVRCDETGIHVDTHEIWVLPDDAERARRRTLFDKSGEVIGLITT